MNNSIQFAHLVVQVLMINGNDDLKQKEMNEKMRIKRYIIQKMKEHQISLKATSNTKNKSQVSEIINIVNSLSPLY